MMDATDEARVRAIIQEELARFLDGVRMAATLLKTPPVDWDGATDVMVHNRRVMGEATSTPEQQRTR